jgi:hypothetical protein
VRAPPDGRAARQGRCRRLAAVHGPLKPLTGRRRAGDAAYSRCEAVHRGRATSVRQGQAPCKQYGEPAGEPAVVLPSGQHSMFRAEAAWCSNPQLDAPRSLAAVSGYEGLQYPAAAGWHRRGLMFASRPRSPPTAPTSHRPEHWLEAATHTIVTWGPPGPTRLTGREPKGSNAAVRSAESASGSTNGASCSPVVAREKDLAQPQPR